MRLVLKLVWLLMHLSLAFLGPDPGETPRTCGECAFLTLLGGVGILFSFSNERWDPRNVPPGFDGRGSAVHSLWPKIALVANRRSCEILPVVWENFGTTIFLKPSQKSKVMALIHAKTNWRSLLKLDETHWRINQFSTVKVRRVLLSSLVKKKLKNK